ncbi:hypothetical protein JTE90_008515 [Oedothorax gibbosus]|uniref:Secreted protein n=1 Tax=Oedothorax gibbosus TaxID=931172 RepID=A0AAV6VI42_9ARAC|nr:hypothetical protein JTE90_008515 [Oedothorax gibbosus]
MIIWRQLQYVLITFIPKGRACFQIILQRLKFIYGTRSSNDFTMALHLHWCQVLNNPAMTRNYRRCLFSNNSAKTQIYLWYQVFK